MNGSIGLPPAGKFHIDLDPTGLVFRNQSIQGTLVSSAQEIDETLEFARRGKIRPLDSMLTSLTVEQGSCISRLQ
jgi:D-arabinose 1-dehydrogenase-like Zn-dependent alcohol dehydrogenase